MVELYIGVTSDLVGRVWQHKNHQVSGFTQTYDICMLVWYESSQDISSAILREKQLKEWKRIWKLRIIENMNPNWDDLYPLIA